MIENDLQQLIEGCKKQDRQSQKLLYQSMYGFAMKICLRYSNNAHEASEVMNDGFFKLFVNIEKYNKELPFKPWLSKIMYHAAIDYYRANLKWSHLKDLEHAAPIASQDSVEQHLGYKDLLRMVQQLPPVYRMVFNLYVVDGYSHEEIAEMVGIGVGTSRSNLYKARVKLQQMLSQPQSLIVLMFWKLKGLSPEGFRPTDEQSPKIGRK